MDDVIYGYLLKSAGKFVCWNSYKANYYLGRESNSEIFSMSDALNMHGKISEHYKIAKALFPVSIAVPIRKEI